MRAADLIAKAKTTPTSFQLPDKAKADVLAVAKYNQTAHRDQRVSTASVLQMLREEHGVRICRSTFDTYCKAVWGQPFGSLEVK